jgi:AcrR family transcriptional regulator
MELKDKIINAVIELFNEKGLKFTMDDVARRIGISKRTIYTVVEDKETLFIDTVNTVFDSIKQSEKEVLEEELDTISKLRKLLIILPERYKTMNFKQFYAMKEKYPEIYRKIEDRLETDWDATLKLMEQAMKEGKIRTINLSVFRAIFTGTIEYYLSRPILADEGMPYQDALEQMLDILFEGLKM